MEEKQIIDAYCRIRTIDQTIPDDVLDFMKDAAIEKLKNIELNQGDYDFIMCALNAYWHEAHHRLGVRSIGDFEKEIYELQLKRSKEIMTKIEEK